MILGIRQQSITSSWFAPPQNSRQSSLSCEEKAMHRGRSEVKRADTTIKVPSCHRMCLHAAFVRSVQYDSNAVNQGINYYVATWFSIKELKWDDMRSSISLCTFYGMCQTSTSHACLMFLCTSYKAKVCSLCSLHGADPAMSYIKQIVNAARSCRKSRDE